MYSIKQLLIAFIIFSTQDCLGQANLSVIGEWAGKLKDSSGEFDYRLKFVHAGPGVYTGVSISSSADFYSETKIKAVEKDGLLTVSEIEVVNTNFQDRPSLCLLKLALRIANSNMSGIFTPLNNTTNCLSGTVSLNKISSSKKIAKALSSERSAKISHSYQSKLKDSTNEVMAPTEAGILKIDSIANRPKAVSRVENKLRVIEINEDEAELIILDNMAVDGDMITLINNDKIIFKRVTLTKIPITYKINNKESSTHLIKFFAENLGSTPPNTGVLIVRAGKSVTKTDFASDFSYTSTVQINLKKAL